MASDREIKSRRNAFESISASDYEFILANKDKMYRAEIAKCLGISLMKLKRIASYKGITFGFYKKNDIYSEDIKRKVLSYYEKFGKSKTAEKYPKVCVRSIVERNNHKPRQIRWKHFQVIEALKMASFVSFKDQARYFNRPRAFKGSITSLWQKKLNMKARNIHGWPTYIAEIFIDTSQCPSVQGSWMNGYRIYLWSQMENFILDDTPVLIKEAIYSMAEFQRWLFESVEPSLEIEKLIFERSSDEKQKK